MRRNRSALALACLTLVPLLGAGCSNTSDGTASPQCARKAGPTGEQQRELVSSGLMRTFCLTVPSGYDGSKPVPLVLDFHGVLSNAAEEEPRSRLGEVGEANGFIVATPDGYHQSWNAESCCSDAQAQHIDDLQFARDMVADIEADYCIDASRIYAAGYSNGGLFAFFLACRAADLVAAIASVEAASPSGASCQPSRPVPVLAFNGTADPIVPYAVSGPTIAEWRQLDACSSSSAITYHNGDSSCETWSECADDTAVELCTIQGGGHVWPGGGGSFPPYLGKVTTDLTGAEESWRFFAAHPKP